MQWFIIHTYTGYEKRVKKMLEEEIRNRKLQDKFGRIFVPVEIVQRHRGKKKIQVEKIKYPGYLFVEMEYDEDTVHLLSNIPMIMPFLDNKEKPQPLKADEVERLEDLIETAENPPERVEVPFKVGDSVAIMDGPFAGFDGIVEEINADKEKVKVSVIIFGRATPVELSFGQVELR